MPPMLSTETRDLHSPGGTVSKNTITQWPYANAKALPRQMKGQDAWHR